MYCGIISNKNNTLKHCQHTWTLVVEVKYQYNMPSEVALIMSCAAFLMISLWEYNISVISVGYVISVSAKPTGSSWSLPWKTRRSKASASNGLPIPFAHPLLGYFPSEQEPMGKIQHFLARQWRERSQHSQYSRQRALRQCGPTRIASTASFLITS